jgi:NADH-quinone oxidoreductase subunit E
MNTGTSIDLRPVKTIVQSMPHISADALIPLLQILQNEYGFLPPEVLKEASRLTDLPISRMFGVATFYEQFHLTPHGRHTVRCCRGTACHVKGGKSISHAISRALGIDEGDTTPDMRFTFETVACLGTCFLAPAMMVDNDYYGLLTAQKIHSILNSYT